MISACYVRLSIPPVCLPFKLHCKSLPKDSLLCLSLSLQVSSWCVEARQTRFTSVCLPASSCVGRILTPSPWGDSREEVKLSTSGKGKSVRRNLVIRITTTQGNHQRYQQRPQTSRELAVGELQEKTTAGQEKWCNSEDRGRRPTCLELNMAGDVKRFTRMLLECNSNDKLCVVREHQTEVIVVPVLLVGFFVIVLTVILWLHCRGLRARQKQSSSSGHQAHDNNQQESSSTENGYIQLSETSVESLLSSASLTLKELEIPREKLSPGTFQLIKHGRYGSIYRAQLETGKRGETKTVVLKALQELASSQEVKDFLGRIKFHQNLGCHENLVELVGCCVDQLPLYMIMEDVSLGDLLTFLWTCRKDVMKMDGVPYDLTERQVYEVGQQVAAALAYLEQNNLFHGDIAARNVLLHHNFTAKLCGLGLAYETHTYGANSVTQIVPVKWQAPERLLKKPPSIKADIWSFGILLYEMITLGAPPYPEVPPSDILSYLQRQNIMKQPSSCQQAMYNIMKSCWQWNAANRPSPADLIQSLQAAMKTSNNHAVLQVPEFVVPELYANVAGIDVLSLVNEYTIL